MQNREYLCKLVVQVQRVGVERYLAKLADVRVRHDLAHVCRLADVVAAVPPLVSLSPKVNLYHRRSRMRLFVHKRSFLQSMPSETMLLFFFSNPIFKHFFLH